MPFPDRSEGTFKSIIIFNNAETYNERNHSYEWNKIKHLLKSKMIILGEMKQLQMDELPKNYQENEIIVLTDEKYPYIFYKGSSSTPNGYTSILWQTIAEYIGLKVKYLRSSNRNLVAEGKSELSLAPAAMEAHLYDKYDFTYVIFKSWYSVYIDERMLSSKVIYYGIWDHLALWAVFGLTLVWTTVQWLILNSRLTFNDEKCECLTEGAVISKQWCSHDQRDTTLVTTLLNIYGLILQQGSQVSPDRKLVSALNFVIGSFGLVVSTAYCGVLTSRITATQQYTSLRAISHQLPAASPAHAVCVPNGSRAFLSVQAQIGEDIFPEWNHFVNRSPCIVTKNNIIAAEDFCKPNVLIIEKHHHVNRHIAKGKIKCKILRDRIEHYVSYLSLIIRKRSQYKEKINHMIVKMMNFGLMERAKRQWLPPADEDYVLTTDVQYSVSFVHVKSLIRYYFLSVLLSVGIFVMELVVFHSNRIYTFLTSASDLLFNNEVKFDN